MKWLASAVLFGLLGLGLGAAAAIAAWLLHRRHAPTREFHQARAAAEAKATQRIDLVRSSLFPDGREA